MAVGSATIAVIGMGRMGAAMATRIAGTGAAVVVWNRDRAKADQVAGRAGVTVVDSAAEAASRADVVISSLADDAAVEAVYLGTGGIVEGLGPGTVAVETSTVDPETQRRVGA
ncbi:MAG TPA: NAD(P)-binding domain-containing protein, partial [Acidimicrobiia bacterium]|nr:NAD(P)-binding domain-containing protein [Acidimicrobiia bacterium]